MVIAGFIKNSLVDYPGLISCVIFVPGCNFNCFYCHNRMLLNEKYEIIDNQSIFDFLDIRKDMLDSVVISGGEPTLYKDLLSYIKEIKKIGYKVKLDTNGSSPHVIKQLLNEEACDYYAVDYKAPKAMYTEICGSEADVSAVHKTIGLLLDSKVDFEVRTTVFPHLSKDDLICMSKELPLLPKYVLNRYRKPQLFLSEDKIRIEKTPYTQKEIEALTESVRAIQPNVLA